MKVEEEDDELQSKSGSSVTTMEFCNNLKAKKPVAANPHVKPERKVQTPRSRR